MKWKPKPNAAQETVITFSLKLQTDEGGKFTDLSERICRETVTSVGTATQELLTRYSRTLDVKRDERGVVSADLVLPLPEAKGRDKRGAALKLLSQGPKEPKPPKSQTPSVMNRWCARPRYRNAYHLVEMEDGGAGTRLRFRLLERFSFEVERAQQEGGAKREAEIIEAYERLRADTLSMISLCWMDPFLSFVAKPFQQGVFQKCAENLVSYLERFCDDSKTGFPSLFERDPVIRETEWRSTLERIGARTEPFPYKLARELTPGKYASDDPRGNRPVNIDTDWRLLIRSPDPGRLPAFTTSSSAIGIFKRVVEERVERAGKVATEKRLRYYACLPVFEGVSSDSPLGRLAANPRCFWWQKHRGEFEPLPVSRAGLPEGNTAIMVPLAVSSQKSARRRFHDYLESGAWELCIGSLVERSVPYENRRSWKKSVWRADKDGRKRRRGRITPALRTEWWVNIALRRTVYPVLRENVLGVHFAIGGMYWCVLSRGNGEMVAQGTVPENPIVRTALFRKGELERLQKRHASIKGRRFAAELQTATYKAARAILAIAEKHDANLALEEIMWVEKRGKDAEANRRYSLWNYSALPGVTVSLGLRECVPPIPTVTRKKDFALRHTCPACRSCVKKGQEKDAADTWRAGDELECRKCGFRGIVPPEFQALLVAEDGVKRANALAAAAA